MSTVSLISHISSKLSEISFSQELRNLFGAFKRSRSTDWLNIYTHSEKDCTWLDSALLTSELHVFWASKFLLVFRHFSHFTHRPLIVLLRLKAKKYQPTDQPTDRPTAKTSNPCPPTVVKEMSYFDANNASSSMTSSRSMGGEDSERQLIESRINLLLKCLQEVEVLRSDTDILRKRVSPCPSL